MAAAAIPIVGGMFGAGGALMEASDKANAYQDQATSLERNATLTRSSAKYNAQRQQMIAGKKMGSIEASNAASGISADSGSVLDVLAASKANAEMDRLTIIHGGEVRAAGLEERARYDRSAADRTRQMGYFNAFSSLFKGAAQGGMMAGGGGGDTADVGNFEPDNSGSNHPNFDLDEGSYNWVPRGSNTA